MQNGCGLLARILSMLVCRPNWTIAGVAAIFAIAVGTWAQRVHAVLSGGDGLQAELVWRALIGNAMTSGWFASRCAVFINRDGGATRTLLTSCTVPRPAAS
jgi:hypothetical protein